MADSRVVKEQFDWQYYVAQSEAGRDWLADFRQPAHAELADHTRQALALLHRRETGRAREHLDTAASSLAGLAGVRPSVVHVLGRFYHGVLAYYHYFTRRFADAHEELRRAARCIVEAVDCDRVLLPIAQDCSEFYLHHARIARNQELWTEMQRYIDTVRDMIEGRRPLCQLADGTPVDYEALVRHFRDLPLDVDARRGLEPLMVPAKRRQLFERFILQIYLRPGFVVPYD